MIENIYSESSFAGCIKKGFNYVIRNPWLVTRVMGPWALVSSIMVVLYYAQSIKMGNQLLTTGITDTSSLYSLFLYTILYAIFSFLFTVRLMIFFRRNQNCVEKKELNKQLNEGENIEVQKVAALGMKDRFRELLHYSLIALPYLIWGYIITILSTLGITNLASVALVQQSTTTICFVFGIILVLICLAIIFALPLVHTFYHTMMKNGEGGFRKQYRAAFRYKGKTFSVIIMAGILTSLLTFTPFMPAAVSYLAYSSSINNLLFYDDPVIITSSGYTLMFIASVISTTVCTLISITYYASLLFLYGTITIQTQNRKK